VRGIFVIIVKVIGAGIVKVYCLLDEAQANDVSVEMQITRGIAGNCCDMMDS
jgi:hypothetical protein